MHKKISEIVNKFGYDDIIKEWKKLEIGHINDTYIVETNNRKFILQRINSYVFKNPVDIMENIERVTSHIRKKALINGKDPLRETLCFLNANNGKNYFIDNDGEYWRLCPYIENTLTYSMVENEEMLYSSGYAFGQFQNILSDFPISTLHETIEDFHNTKKRMDCFFDIVEKDPCGRAKYLKEDIKFFADRREKAGKLIDLVENGDIPIRVTHNDTKFDNILIDKDNFQAVCVIDLDTVMPGLAVYDFGDAIRIIGNNAAEDETDLSKVTFNINYFETFTKGFLSGVDGLLTPIEIDNLVLGCVNITIELASRFLADYLNGDKYFKISRPLHNLERARNQMKLVVEMEKQTEKMNDVVNSYK